LLTAGVVQPRIVVVNHGLRLLPQEQKEEEEMILDQSRGLRVGEWTEIVGLHCHLLVMDEIGLITTIVVRTPVNESEIKIGIGIGVLLARVGRLRLRLVVGRDRGTDQHRRISQRQLDDDQLDDDQLDD
jgi:hypothetical protein